MSFELLRKKDHIYFPKVKTEVSSALATSFSQLKIRNYYIFDVPKLIWQSIAINNCSAESFLK